MSQPLGILLKTAATAGACHLLGPAGVLIGPALATAAGWASETAARWAGDDAAIQALGKAATAALAGIFGNLSATASQNLITRITPLSNGDLEAATAAAIREALQHAKSQLQSSATLVHPKWFQWWDARLAKPNESLFHSDAPADPVQLAQDGQAAWWAKFQPVLLRWAKEQDPAAPSELPPHLADHLRDNLQSYVQFTFDHVLRHPDHNRAWIGYQQRFLTHLAGELSANHADLAAHLQRIAHQQEDLRGYLSHLDSRLDRIEHRPLPLETLAQRRKHEIIKSPTLAVLSAYNSPVTLQGRDRQLREMFDWVMGHPQRISVRMLVGRAGSGKTRFAVELLHLFQHHHWWHTGFLSSSALADFVDKVPLHGWCWSKPTFVVIDYASASVTHLKKWLEALATTDPEPTLALRILLLDRQASTSFQSERTASLFERTEPYTLDPIEQSEQRRYIMKATLMASGEKRALIPEKGVNPGFDQRLAEDRLADPLILQMAALNDRPIEALALTRTDLAFHLAGREQQRIRRFAAPRTETAEDFLIHMAACVTLASGLQDSLAVIKREAAARGITTYEPAQCAKDLDRALGNSPIQPDIVGEAFILETFRHAKQDGEDLVLRLKAPALPALIRISQNFAFEELLAPTKDGVAACVLDWLGALIHAGEVDDPALLEAIDAAMPEETVALRPAAARVTELMIERLRALSEDEQTEDVLAERARLANNLSIRWGDLGRREEALAASEEAVRIRRHLSQTRPDAFLHYLADSLNNLSNRLSDLGCREEALAASEETVRIRRQLAQTRPDDFLPDLASSLNNLSNRLSNLGHHEEALTASEEAVRIYRQLAQTRPDAFLPYLAMSLSNLSIDLSNLGRHEEALAPIEEAVRVYRQLAQTRPDAFLPTLALSLNNLSITLSNLGRHEEALTASEEAVRIYRQLAQTRPDAFLPYLAISLANSSLRHQETNQFDIAHAHIQEAVQVLLPFCEKHPAAFSRRMRPMTQDYIEACQAAGQQPDPRLSHPSCLE